MIAVVWQFEVRAGQHEAFEQFYGADGDWTAVSRRSRSFLGSSFLRDQAQESRYLLIEYWSEMVVYERHQADFSDEMRSLEERRRDACVSMTPARPLQRARRARSYRADVEPA